MVLAAGVDLKQLSVKDMTQPAGLGCSGRGSLSRPVRHGFFS